MAKEWQVDRARKNPPRLSWIALGAITALTVALLPFAPHSAPVNVSILPTTMGVVMVAELLTALLLLQQFVSGGRARVLGFAMTFLFAACMATAFGATAPGLLTSDGLFPDAPGVSSLLGTMSLLVFPTLLALSYAVEPYASHYCGPTRHRGVFALTVVVVTLTAAGTFIAGIVALGVLTTDLDGLGRTSVMTTGLGPWVVAADLVAFIYVARRSEKARSIDRWILVASGSCVANAIISVASSEPFSVGMYAGQFLGVATAAIVLVALAAEINDLYRKAENDKQILEDETLRLLRETRIVAAREARVRRVIDTAADAYIELDVNGLITHWNHKTSQMFGLEGEMVDRARFVTSLFDKSAARPLASAIAILRHAREETEEFRLELMARNSAGGNVPVEVTMWTHDTGDDHKIHVFVRDVTLQRQAEEQLQRALDEERMLVQRLQELDRTKSDFVSSISHELRTPLTSTLGFLEMLGEDITQTLTDEQAYMVKIAERNGQRLLALIEDLLTLSRIETGAFSVQYRPLEIAPLVHRAIDDWRAAAAAQNVSLNLQMHSEDLGLLPGDEVQMIKALGNVMSNAVKFTPPGGTVDVAVRRTGETFAIVVSDTGIGIPLEEQSQLFKRFFRSSIAVEQAHSGAGLGLPIARAVIEHHGGSIRISSSVDAGTTVTIVLPAVGTNSPL